MRVAAGNTSELVALGDQVIAIEIKDLGQTVYWSSQSGQVTISCTTETPANVTLKGSTVALFMTSVAQASGQPVAANAVQITGDMHVAMQVQNY